MIFVSIIVNYSNGFCIKRANFFLIRPNNNVVNGKILFLSSKIYIPRIYFPAVPTYSSKVSKVRCFHTKKKKKTTISIKSVINPRINGSIQMNRIPLATIVEKLGMLRSISGARHEKAQDLKQIPVKLGLIVQARQRVQVEG